MNNSHFLQNELANFHGLMAASPAPQARKNGFFDNLFGGGGGKEHLSKPVLSKGSSGAEVTTLQNKLKSRGAFPYTVDGIFGSQTENAVKAFQTAQGIPASGTVDAQTWAAVLNETYKPPKGGGGGGSGQASEVITAGSTALTDLITSFTQPPANQQQLLDPNLTSGDAPASADSIKWGQWALVGGGLVVVGGVLFVTWRAFTSAR